jgi:hypothetical protein
MLLPPGTFSALIQNVDKLLGIRVETVYNEFGDIILSLQELRPGSIIFISSHPSEESFQHTEAVTAQFNQNSDIFQDANAVGNALLNFINLSESKSTDVPVDIGIQIPSLLALLKFLTIDYSENPQSLVKLLLPQVERFARGLTGRSAWFQRSSPSNCP